MFLTAWRDPEPLGDYMRRRDFITLLGGAAAWPLAAQAQQPKMPVIAFVSGGSADSSTDRVRAFRKGLGETGYVEGQNATVEQHWLEGQYDGLPALMADLVRRRVAVIATPPGDLSAIAAKAATATIPIVFAVSEDPVRLGLVASLARPGGNATGVNFFVGELRAKRLGLLHELVPKSVRVAVLWNPAGATPGDTALRDLQEAARTIGLQIRILNASTSREIDAAFATLARERPDALFVGADGLFASRRAQLAILAAVNKIPAAYGSRDYAVAGGLMSYGTDFADTFRQVGIYTGRILKGAKPADLPVQQSTKFELVINLQTARALGIEVPPDMLTRADEVIE
jgi:putative ABC transport system substrate-binding protein